MDPSASSWDESSVFHGACKATTVNVICIVFMTLTAVAIVLRLWSRAFIVRAMGADDYLILVAAFFAWMLCIIALLGTRNRLGRHIDTVSVHPKAYTTYLILIWASAIAYTSCLASISFSVLALYLRLSPSNFFRRLSIGMIVIVAMQVTSNVITVIFQCTPVNYLWDRTIEGGKCIDINAFYLANAGLNIFTDIATYTLPMRTLWSLNMPKQQKLGLCVILGLGGVACIASIVRISLVPRMLTDPDRTYVIAEPMYWSLIDTNLGILAASIPSYKILVKRYLPNLWGSSNGGNDGQYTFTQSDAKAGIFRMKPRKHSRTLSFMRSQHRNNNKKVTFTNTTIVGPDDYELRNVHANDSAERIIDVPEGKIIATTAVTLRVEEESEGEESERDSFKQAIAC